MIGTARGLTNAATVALAVALALAFLFGYTLSTLPLIQAGAGFGAALTVVFAADMLWIAVMEIVDNLVTAIIPGAMDAGLVSPIFWIALTTAFIAAFPVNRYLIDRGKGHPLRHKFHATKADHDAEPARHAGHHAAHARLAPEADAGQDGHQHHH